MCPSVLHKQMGWVKMWAQPIGHLWSPASAGAGPREGLGPLLSRASGEEDLRTSQVFLESKDTPRLTCPFLCRKARSGW